MKILDNTPSKQFLGLWLDRNGNLLLITSLEANTVKVSFASGKTKSPVKRSFLQQQPTTIDVDGEYDSGNQELIVQFGIRYFEPTLHLKYESADIHKGKPSLRPSYKLSESTPSEKKEWMKWFEPLENYVLIDDSNRTEEIKSLYKI